MAQYKDYYKILGVNKTASETEIKKAFKTAARKYHPDLHKDADKATMTEKFKDVNEAYEVLSDKQKRQVYDQLGPDYQNHARSGGGTGGYSRSYGSNGPQGGQYQQYYGNMGGGFGGGKQNFSGGFGAGDFSDFFQSIFGGMGDFGEADFGTNSFGSMKGQPGQQADEAGLSISLEDAHRGGKMQLTLPSGKTATVNIPAGIRDGQTLKLKGLGSTARNGAPRDLYLKISIEPHARFTHNKQDLDIRVPVMPWTAVLGGQITVPTLDGNVKIKIPAGTQSGKRMKLSGKGLGGKGDLYVKIIIDVPKAPTAEQIKLFEKLQEIS
ncbi:Chaperone DnaJ domain protein [Elusimicrobium minutum Pei191]|uniref:Chaperone DnaJ domain protein n=1 Tax=Elusimicrobium minutum (strain Pei191) TaxID=445932 RepID=B2KCV0_ELUMP|nr:DnaJ C-terminal domain-containing protein [Elusimicrobium minutum]ACC98346.1 Chaperone DnaJ domain protein [Elusimicrobium minutum Pei191]